MSYTHYQLILLQNNEIKDKINDLIKKNDVCLFMKGTPEQPQCGFSMAVSNVLKTFKR